MVRLDRLLRRPQKWRAARAHPVADFTAQSLGPDAKPPGSIEHPTAPGALVHQPIRGTRIGQSGQGWQGQLDQARNAHQDADDTMRVNTHEVERVRITTSSPKHAGKRGQWARPSRTVACSRRSL